MEWKDKSTDNEIIFVAAGDKGAFLLWQIRSSKFCNAKYIGKTKNFQFPRQKSVEAMKKLCEENDYWEN